MNGLRVGGTILTLIEKTSLKKSLYYFIDIIHHFALFVQPNRLRKTHPNKFTSRRLNTYFRIDLLLLCIRFKVLRLHGDIINNATV